MPAWFFEVDHEEYFKFKFVAAYRTTQKPVSVSFWSSGTKFILFIPTMP